jgi:hypothetical protein
MDESLEKLETPKLISQINKITALRSFLWNELVTKPEHYTQGQINGMLIVHINIDLTIGLNNVSADKNFDISSDIKTLERLEIKLPEGIID